MTYVPSDRKFSPHQCDDSHGEGEIKLACGYMMSVIVAGALSRDVTHERDGRTDTG